LLTGNSNTVVLSLRAIMQSPFAAAQES
jgi:hypothetical protein